ncbi:MAG TPA: glycosyltransferase [Syntrophobacteria bacterium]|nr:glycosyltransferase [Syntrophobacteria bacterium]
MHSTTDDRAPISVSIGVMAHNEQANVGRLLQVLTEQKTRRVVIDEILVVSSGSTDGTDDIVGRWEKRDPRIRLIRQERREGKACAINVFLREARNDLLVLESADTLPLSNTVELLVRPLEDERVGMTGARPIPVNGRESLLGAAVHLMWDLHHRLALERPKLGEMVAFRKVLDNIPPESAVDEASLEAAICGVGLTLVYVPEAIVRNKGPKSIGEFLRQRRRIQAGHLWLRAASGYRVSTSSVARIVNHLVSVCSPSARGLLVAAGAVLLEGLGRGLGWFDFRVRKKNPFIWTMAPSTKNLARGGGSGARLTEPRSNTCST